MHVLTYLITEKKSDKCIDHEHFQCSRNPAIINSMYEDIEDIYARGRPIYHVKTHCVP